MNSYSFHPESHAEFKDAAIYYYEKSPSLASAFYTEVENAIQKIVEKPDLYHFIDEDVRRCMTRRFPYAIYH